jgi:hypothetical protein
MVGWENGGASPPPGLAWLHSLVAYVCHVHSKRNWVRLLGWESGSGSPCV